MLCPGSERREGDKGVLTELCAPWAFPQDCPQWCRAACTSKACWGGTCYPCSRPSVGDFTWVTVSIPHPVGWVSLLVSLPHPWIHPLSFLVLLCDSGAGSEGCPPNRSSRGTRLGTQDHCPFRKSPPPPLAPWAPSQDFPLRARGWLSQQSMRLSVSRL